MDAVPCVAICVVPLVTIIPAVILLGWLDRRRFRLREEKRPIQERIDRIRDDARYMAEQFERTLERTKASSSAEKTAWIPPMISFFRRLESLAASQNPDLQDVVQLAKEAATYTREHPIKGLPVAQEAEKLALLLRKKTQV
jgi:hypothetical protein